ncbi:MAG: GNAT family N-acetyltransferase [Saprospiraceae bacterium]|nr:GNAT family N-acetyltransferase [Saprospiraceae bacterium]
MNTSKTNTEFQVCNTDLSDLKTILWLFDEAIKLQSKNGYKVWGRIDEVALQKDITNNLQFKIVKGDNILCVFSIQHNDPFIWQDKDQNNAIYLHRIVTNPNFKGQRLFEKVLIWATQFARQNNREHLRMDTWADNHQLIAYYKSYGFRFVENYITTDTEELPLQNRNLNVALLELTVD